METDCETYGTGWAGSINDGCPDDDMEIVACGVCIFILALTVWILRKRIKHKVIQVNWWIVLIGMVTVMSSVYHIVFGEGDLSMYPATDTRRIILNTREVTLPLQYTIFATIVSKASTRTYNCKWECCCCPPSAAAAWMTTYALFAWIGTALVETERADLGIVEAGSADAYYDIFDALGIVVGGVIWSLGISTYKETPYSPMAPIKKVDIPETVPEE